MSLTPVVAVTKGTRSTRTARGWTVHGTWVCLLKCNHVKRVDRAGRGGPPTRLKCITCAIGAKEQP